MKRESVLEARTGNNDYGAGCAFDLSNKEDENKQKTRKRKNYQSSANGAIKTQTTKRG